MLTRRRTLGLLGGVASASLAGGPLFAQARLSYDLRPQVIAPDVWMIEGATEYFTQENGGAIVNCVLLKGATGMIVVDTGSSRRYGEALSTLVRGLDLRGVSAVVNTHHHPDHFFGNQVFADKPIFALGETQVQAQAMGDAFADNMYRILGDWMRGTEVVTPNAVLSGGALEIDGRAFTALPLAGHTAADLALLDMQTGLLIAGDLVFLDRAPTTPHADLAVWDAALTTLEATQATAVVPGHGPLDRTGQGIGQTRSYLTWLDETLRAAARGGYDMVEIMDMPVPEPFASMGAQPQEFHRSIAHLFPGIEVEVLPRGN